MVASTFCLFCIPKLLFQMMLTLGFLLVLYFAIGIPIYLFIMKMSVRRKKLLATGPTIVGFFHPYCNSGGGGERVLWCAIKAMQLKFRDIKVVVYTGDLDASPDAILARAQQRFNIALTSDAVEFVYLHRRTWIEASKYPYFTLLGQSVGSVALALEAISARPPDVFIDTAGHAFAMAIFKHVASCKAACYVHYPTITTEMLHKVSQREEAHNNRRFIARSRLLSRAKLLYYRLFAKLYKMAGSCADVVMVNSSWTEEHVNALWQSPLTTHRVYPPCDVDDLKKIHSSQSPELEKEENKTEDAASKNMADSDSANQGDTAKPTKKLVKFDEKVTEESENLNLRSKQLFKIVSLGQFRPEKDHPMQLRAMYALRQILPEQLWEKVHLVFVGSCRDRHDETRVKDMQDLAKHLSLEDNVQFKVNLTYEELKEELRQATAGLHAMWNEHFGIGVVECMAAGLIMVAHNSGGPKMDIVETAAGSRTGFLAEDEAGYARALATILLLPVEGREKISKAARSSVDRFSTAEFEKGFLRAIEPFFRDRQ